MKRFLFLFCMLTLMLGSMGCQKKVHEFWISEDKVTAFKEPSENAPVIRDLYTLVPVKVVEKDSTGQWGRVRLNYILFKKSAWLPLNQMTYCGSDNLEEELETCVVKPETLQLYKSPKANKDNVRISLYQNDTVQITARENNWVHVRCLKYSYGKLDDPAARYGWVAENQLQSIGVLTNEVLSAAETEKTSKMVDAKLGERFSPKMVNVHKIYAKACEYIGWATVGIVLLLLIPAHRRNKILALLLMLPLGALLVFMGMKCVVPSWYFAFMIPLMVYVVCYPLLYFDSTTSWFAYLLFGLNLLAAGYYLYLYTSIILCVLLLGVCVGISFFIWKQRNEDICPYCGRYAIHETVSTKSDKSKVSEGVERRTNLVDSKKNYVDGHWVTTDYVKEVTYDTEQWSETKTYTRKCEKCGNTFKQKEHNHYKILRDRSTGKSHTENL